MNKLTGDVGWDALEDAAELPELRAFAREQRAEAEHRAAMFDLTWRRMREATDRWQKAHPDLPNVELTWPDLGEMLYWLLERNTLLETGVKDVTRAIREEIARVRAQNLAETLDEPDMEQVLSELSFYVAGAVAGYEWRPKT